MSEAKHSPTPWYITRPQLGFAGLYASDDQIVFALAYARKDERTEDECDANAAYLLDAVNGREEAITQARADGYAEGVEAAAKVADDKAERLATFGKDPNLWEEMARLIRTLTAPSGKEG